MKVWTFHTNPPMEMLLWYLQKTLAKKTKLGDGTFTIVKSGRQKVGLRENVESCNHSCICALQFHTEDRQLCCIFTSAIYIFVYILEYIFGYWYWYIRYICTIKPEQSSIFVIANIIFKTVMVNIKKL